MKTKPIKVDKPRVVITASAYYIHADPKKKLQMGAGTVRNIELIMLELSRMQTN